MLCQNVKAFRFDECFDSEIGILIHESALRYPEAKRLGYDSLILASALEETVDKAGLREVCRLYHLKKVDALLLRKLTPAQMCLLDQLERRSSNRKWADKL
jgi:hypothetical protein